MQDKIVLAGIRQLLDLMRSMKPEERSERSRRIAIAITELEKVLAYWLVFVAGDEK